MLISGTLVFIKRRLQQMVLRIPRRAEDFFNWFGKPVSIDVVASMEEEAETQSL